MPQPQIRPIEMEPEQEQRWVPINPQNPPWEGDGGSGGGDSIVRFRRGDPPPDDPDDPDDGNGGGGGGGGGGPDDDCCTQFKRDFGQYIAQSMAGHMALNDAPRELISSMLRDVFDTIINQPCDAVLADASELAKDVSRVAEMLREYMQCTESEGGQTDNIPDVNTPEENVRFSDEFADKYASEDEPIDIAWGILKTHTWIKSRGFFE